MQQFLQNTAQAVPVFEGYAIPHAIFKMKARGVENIMTQVAEHVRFEYVFVK